MIKPFLPPKNDNDWLDAVKKAIEVVTKVISSNKEKPKKQDLHRSKRKNSALK